jgi:hypothetical protein
MRGQHQDAQRRTVNTKVPSRGCDGHARRQTVGRHSDGAPARSARRRGARERLQTARAAPLPSGEEAETAARRREVTGARVNGGGSARTAAALDARVSATGGEAEGWRRLYRAGPLGVRVRGPGRGGANAEFREAGSGRVLPPVRLRLEVEDDGRGPPVGDCSRAAAGMGRCWAETAGAGCARGLAGGNSDWAEKLN